MQQFQDLPLPITAGAGAAIVLILVLVTVLVRRSRAAGDPARATAAKPPRKTRPPKPPKKVRMSRSERRRARRAMKDGSGIDDYGDPDPVTVTNTAAAAPATEATPRPSSAIPEDRAASPADPDMVTAPSVDAEPPVAATPGGHVTESIWEPPVMTEDADAELTAPIALPEALTQAESPVVVSSARESEWAIPIEDDPEYDPASAWMTADSDDVRWTNEASDAPVRGRTDDIPAVPGSPDEWPTGSWESIEKLLPEAPQIDIGWGDAWDPDESAGGAVAHGGPEIPVSAADGLDWSALGTVDADLPHDEWAADALAREATADAAREESPADDAASDSPWEPVDTVIETPRDAGPAPDGPPVWPATTPSPEDDGTTGPSPVTPDAAATMSLGETADAAAPPADPDASTVPVGSVGGTPVVIDLATLAGLGRSMELVIEPNDDGNGLRLHLARRDDVDDAPPPAPADVTPATSEVTPQLRESAPQPPAPGGSATTDPLGAEPVPVAVDGADAPAVAPQPTTAVNGWWNASAPAADADRVGARAPVPAEGDPDPARILADIRARLAALDARRNGDVPPI